MHSLAIKATSKILTNMNESMLIQANNFAHDFPQPRSKDFSYNFVNAPHKANGPKLLDVTPATLGSKLIKVAPKLFSKAHLS